MPVPALVQEALTDTKQAETGCVLMYSATKSSEGTCMRHVLLCMVEGGQVMGMAPQLAQNALRSISCAT